MAKESERVWVTLLQRGASIVCPVCDAKEWKGFGDLGNLRVMLPAATGHGDLVVVPGQAGGMGAFAFACANCGFLRLHSTDVLGERHDEAP